MFFARLPPGVDCICLLLDKPPCTLPVSVHGPVARRIRLGLSGAELEKLYNGLFRI